MADFPARGGNQTNITTATTTTIKSGAGILLGIMINTGQASATATIFDSTTGSGTKIGTFTASAQGGPFVPAAGIKFSNGLTVVTVGATPADITIVWA